MLRPRLPPPCVCPHTQAGAVDVHSWRMHKLGGVVNPAEVCVCPLDALARPQPAASACMRAVFVARARPTAGMHVARHHTSC
jgi:hypothetical protein